MLIGYKILIPYGIIGDNMSQFFMIHPDNPQSRLIRQSVNLISSDGLVVLPTDSGYALGCKLGSKSALQRIKRIRQLEDQHNFSIMVRDIAMLQKFAMVSTQVYRILRAYTPGAYTFILPTTKHLHKTMQSVKKKTIGMRMPNNKIIHSLLQAYDHPILITSLLLPGNEISMIEPNSIKDALGKQVDLIIDAGNCPHAPTTVVDLTKDFPEIIRIGSGDPKPFQA